MIDLLRMGWKSHQKSGSEVTLARRLERSSETSRALRRPPQLRSVRKDARSADEQPCRRRSCLKPCQHCSQQSLLAQAVPSCKVWEDYTAFQTTDATQSVAYTFSLANNAATHLDVLVTAINSGKTAGGSFKRSADFRNNDGTAAQINATQDGGSNLDAGLIWQCTIDRSGSSARVLVTGAAGTTVRWGIYVSVMETTPDAVLFQQITIDPLSLSTPVMVIDAETGVYPAVDDGDIDSVINQGWIFNRGQVSRHQPCGC